MMTWQPPHHPWSHDDVAGEERVDHAQDGALLELRRDGLAVRQRGLSRPDPVEPPHDGAGGSASSSGGASEQLDQVRAPQLLDSTAGMSKRRASTQVVAGHI